MLMLNIRIYLSSIIISLLLLSGCATTGSNYKEAIQHQKAGNLWKALDLIKLALKENPESSKIKKQYTEIKFYLRRKYDNQLYNVHEYNLPEKRQFLIRLLRIEDESYTESQEIQLKEVELKIEETENQAKNILEEQVLIDVFKKYVELHAYEPYFDSIKAIRDKITSSQELLSAEIDKLAQDGEYDDALVITCKIADLFPNNKFFIEKKKELLKQKALESLSLADEYISLKNNERVATALGYLLLAWNYNNEVSGLENKISKQVQVLGEGVTPTIIVEFTGGFSDANKKELMKSLNLYGLKDIRNIEKITNTEECDNCDIIAEIELTNISMETESLQETKFSKFLAGYQQVPNQEYDALLLKYTEAQRRAQNASKEESKSSGGTSLAIIGGVLKGLNQRQLNDNVNNLSNRLAATPRYLQKEIYQDYQYYKTTYNFHLDSEINIKLKDPSTLKVFLEDKLVDKHIETRTAISGAHPKDYNRVSNKNIGEAEAKGVLASFRENKFKELSEKIMNVVFQKPLYDAKIAYNEKRYAECIEDMLMYKFLVVFQTIGTQEEVSRNAINRISETMGIPKIDNRIVVINLDKNINCDFSLGYYFKASFANDKLLPSQYGELIKAFEKIDAREVTFKKSGSNALLTKAIGLKDYLVKKISSTNQPDKQVDSRSTVEQCLDALVVIKTLAGTGSGFIVNDKGYVITNYHVIANQDDIIVKTRDGKKFFADIVLQIKYKDLALLKINFKNSQYLPLCDMKNVSIGETVYAMGAPGGQKEESLEQTVTKGIVSAIRMLDAPNNTSMKVQFIQTDAAINPGNSGGPLINEKGEVVGVNTQKIVATDVEGINFSVSVDELQKSFAEYLN